MIKLIATDIDGTLLPEGTSVLNEELADTIRELKKRGITFVVASGRGYASIASLFRPVVNDIVIMAENGAYVREGERVLFTRAFDRETFLETLDMGRSVKPIFVMTATTSANYTDSKNEAFITKLENGYKVAWNRVEDLRKQEEEDLLKVAIYMENDSAEAAEKLEAYFGGRICVMTSGAHWIDMVPAGTDKGFGVREIQSILGISRGETMAFGDNGNDIAMLDEAEHSYAVSNARDEVKAAAAHVIGDCGDGAVLSVLKTLL